MRRNVRRAFVLAPATAAIVLAAQLAPGQDHDAPAAGEWSQFSGDLQGTKYSPLDRITAENADQLGIAWRWPSPDREIEPLNPRWRASKYQDTPLIIDGVMYTVTTLGLVAALDPGTGRTLWVHDPESYQGFDTRPANGSFSHRGMAYWRGGAARRLLIGTVDAQLLSIDTETGRPDPAFGERGKVDLAADVRQARRGTNFVARRPIVAGDVVIVGTAQADGVRQPDGAPPGLVQAFDVRTGARRWTFHLVPEGDDFGYDTWHNGSAAYGGNTNVWAGITYDPDLGYVYLASSTPSSDYYGGHRPGSNLFAESVICLDAATGGRVWHFQTVHHGLWDYDLPAEPVLGEILVDGREIKAVMVVSKQGFTYTFDRATGEPGWPIEERPVPPGDVPGEWYAPTQPFPTRPPAFALQGAVEDNLVDFTPDLRRRALERLRTYRYGPLFTPPSLQGTAFLPGVWGGARWGGGAFDPETGWLFVPSVMMPSVARLRPGDPSRTDFRYVSGGGLAATDLRIDGLSIFKPPYSHVTAIDMNQGEQQWKTPLGDGPLNHPLLRDLDLPPLGNGPQHTHVLVTRTLLLVSVTYMTTPGGLEIPAWAEWADADMLRQLIFVLDKATGDLVHVVRLDGNGAAQPMTYLHAGRQYIAVAVGGAGTAEIVALGLP